MTHGTASISITIKAPAGATDCRYCPFQRHCSEDTFLANVLRCNDFDYSRAILEPIKENQV